MRVGIIGAGTYGSYLARLLADECPHVEVTIFEVGAGRSCTEAEIGLRSSVVQGQYAALTRGRYFGLGGTSARWGGQILMFSRNDFAAPSTFLEELVRLNEVYRDTVLRRLGVPTPAPEYRLSSRLFVKSGVWLGYRARNLFRGLRVASLRSVQVRTGSRVTKLLHEGPRIVGVVYTSGGVVRQESFDHYFLTAGAFESNRLLAVSGIVGSDSFRFSDHLSQPAFRVVGGTRIGATDFRFRFRGSSLVTHRLVGEVDGVSFFAHPIFNSSFPFFQNLKKVLFQREITKRRVGALLLSIPSAAAFCFSALVLRRLYVHDNCWSLQLDLENHVGSGWAALSEVCDAEGQPGLEIGFAVDDRTSALFDAARAMIRDYLQREGVDFEELPAATHGPKYEDTYHPFGMYGSDSTDVEHFFSRHENLLVANTGVLPRAGGINCTAAVFPLIEEYVATRLRRRSLGDSGGSGHDRPREPVAPVQ